MEFVKLKALIEEDFIQYKKANLFLGTCKCDFKCLKEINKDISICQNSELATSTTISISVKELIKLYTTNPITESVVFGGLEPILQFEEILAFIDAFRKISNDDIVIYTGYYPTEIKEKLFQLEKYSNIIFKYGRFVPESESKYDKVLGVTLSSKNQYGERLENTLCKLK